MVTGAFVGELDCGDNSSQTTNLSYGSSFYAKKIAPEMRMTIPNLIVCSMKTGDVGDERNVLKCENNLRKGTSDFIRFQTPRLNSFNKSDLRDSLLLPDQTTGSGVVCSGSAIKKLWRVSSVR
jgi:hypothetical protein